MPVFSSLSSFFNRHKRKLIVTSAFAVSAYFLIDHFIVKKFRNFQNSLKQELIFKQQIKQRFIQTQQDCYHTILALLPVLTAPIVDSLPVELITKALRLKKNNPGPSPNANNGDNSQLTTDNLNLLENNQNPDSELAVYLSKSKIELWNLLKIKTITRTLTLIYAISGLLLITRVQLNILARRSYLESAILMAGVKSTSTAESINPQENYIIEQTYLSLSWWLLNKGWANLHSLIEPLVVKHFESINPKSELSISDFQGILSDIVNELNHPSVNISENLFPIHYDDVVESLLNVNPELISQLDSPESNLFKLVNETKSIISNDNASYFHNLFSTLVTSSLNTLHGNLLVNLQGGSSSLLLNSSTDLKEEKIVDLESINTRFKLASFLAQLSVQNGIIIDNNNIKYEEEDDIEGFINNLSNPDGFGNGPKNLELSGNAYVNEINNLDELDEFSAGIYSNFE
ncbi:Peroxin-3 [Suhomyces tanzawaensis NRRL Y-17324]|uniref:Peroxin-3 n=1 Tax=Suhomyces tanzawaensis NRRL Y-17324 TaxID=984487 RepID=A0A1E4SDH0_9ASCO|nr:Peroxin-3 [Suhomyces tanzawaensis NRRL Y-17324]ODV77518.1 Peroxin-3 [Suhomyces tanzawaensis NRRL Y-17324]